VAGGRERILRRRIRTVQSTKKITRAFELIAASQIVRAQGRLAGSRPYVEGIAKALAVTASEVGGAAGPEPAGAPMGGPAEQPAPAAPARGAAAQLIGDARGARRVLLVVMVGDRGLAGGYNSFALRAADRLMREGESSGRQYRVVAVGRKAQAYFRFRGRQVEHVFVGMTDRPRFADAREVAARVVRPFLAGEVDLVQVVSWRFRSAGVQTVETRQLLPLPTATLQALQRSQAGGAGGSGRAGAASGGAAPGAQLGPSGAPQGTSGPGPSGGPGVPAGRGGPAATADVEPAMAGPGPGAPPPGTGAAEGQRVGASYEFEPDPVTLLGILVPQYAEAELFRALLEASASEHTARQRAMAAATENADELITTYRRQMNRARQETITTEIMEIVGGAEALRQASRQSSSREYEPSGLGSEERIA
jgi:F-type H+-transporting ATPase subunit gamma